MRELILPVMQQVSDKVDFQLSYIGKPTENDGVECKHGPGECMGNIIELCARELYPDPKINLGFIMCLTKDYKHIPERSLVEDCALEHAIDMNAINECATKDDGAHGMGLLRTSVARSAEVSVLSDYDDSYYYTWDPYQLTPYLSSASLPAAQLGSTARSIVSVMTVNGPNALPVLA